MNSNLKNKQTITQFQQTSQGKHSYSKREKEGDRRNYTETQHLKQQILKLHVWHLTPDGCATPGVAAYSTCGHFGGHM